MKTVKIHNFLKSAKERSDWAQKDCNFKVYEDQRNFN